MSQADPCVSRLLQAAQRDPFLGAVDQRPQLDTTLNELADSFARFEQKAQQRLQELTTRLTQSSQTAREALQQCHSQLAAGFSVLSDSPTSITVLRSAHQALEEELKHFVRRIHPRVALAVNAAHPRHKLWTNLFEELKRFRRDITARVPEHILIRYPCAAAPSHAGKNLAESECLAELPGLCRYRVLARLGLWNLRRRLRRRYRHVVVPLREMVYLGLIEHSNIDPDDTNQRHQTTHSELEHQLQDATRNLRFNLETAAAEIADFNREQTPEQASARINELKEMVLSAITRSIDTIDETMVIYASIFEGMLNSIVEEHRRDLITIRNAIEETGSLRGRWRWQRYRLTKSFKAVGDRLHNYSEFTLTRIKNRWHKIHNGLRRRSLQLQEWLGFAELTDDVRLRLTDLPSFSELRAQAEQLPPLYRRLFSTKPLISREFLVGLDQELKTLHDAAQRWQQGLAVNIAVIGPEGTGKTSLLNCFENEIDSKLHIKHISLDKRLISSQDILHHISDAYQFETLPTTTAELIQRLHDQPRAMIVVEHCHLLYLRTIGAREAIETFLHVMMQTREHLLWVTTFRHYPWQRLNYLFDIESYYTHILHTPFHDKTQLREAIERRQRASNLTVLYSDTGLRSRRIEKLRLTYRNDSPTLQDALAEVYFDTLYRITGGNMIAALFFWLQSITAESDGSLRVKPCQRIDERFIGELERHYQFSLAEVLGHGGLSPEEHATIFRTSTEQSRLLLDYLREIRLLEGRQRDEFGQRRYYVINPIFHSMTTQLLNNMNILH